MSRSIVFFFIHLFIYTSDGTPLGDRPRLSENKYGYLTHFIPAQWGKDSEMSYHWPKGEVPYFFDSSSYDDMLKDKVRMSMASLERDSCIRFKEQTAKPATNGSSWLHFTNKNKQRHCFHTPSYRASSEIEVILGYDCLKQGEIMHSVLHGIGFRDEVTHPQRDVFVKILWGNIRPSSRVLFRTQPVERPAGLLEYDPKSIMHFHDHAFSINGQATINPLLPGLKITPSDHLSHLDKMKLGIMFGHECNRRKVSEVLDTCQGLFSGGKSSGSESSTNVNPDSQKQDKINNDYNKNGTSNDGNEKNEGENITDDSGKENTDKSDKQQSGNESENNIKNVIVIGGYDESEKTGPVNDGGGSDNQSESGMDDSNNENMNKDNESTNMSENVITGNENIDSPNKIDDNQSENVQDDSDTEDADVVNDKQSENVQDDSDVEDAHVVSDTQSENVQNDLDAEDADVIGGNQSEIVQNDSDIEDADVDTDVKQKSGNEGENNIKNVIVIAGHDENDKNDFINDTKNNDVDKGDKIGSSNELSEHSGIDNTGVSENADKEDADADKNKQQGGSESENTIKNVVVIAGHGENERIDSPTEGGPSDNQGESASDDLGVDKSDKQQSENENNNTIKNVVVIAGHDESEKTGPANDGDSGYKNQEENNMEIDNVNIQNENDIDNDDNRIENASVDTEGSFEDLNNSKQSNSDNKNSDKIANVLIVSNSDSKIEQNPKETKSNLNNKHIQTGNDNENYDNDYGVVNRINRIDDTDIKMNSEINEDYKLRASDDGNQDQDENLSQDLESKGADKNTDSGHNLDADNNDLSNNIDDNNDKVVNVLIASSGRRNDAKNTKSIGSH